MQSAHTKTAVGIINMSRKYFGTDGIRGRVGDAPITPEFVMKLGYAAGKVFAAQGKRNFRLYV